MATSTILVSPTGYDDVHAILKRLGGSLASAVQLEDEDVSRLHEISYLAQFRHVFINCHSMFASTVDRSLSDAVRDFVIAGGSIYVSDWGCSLIEACFGSLVAFSSREGAPGVISGRVADPYLLQRLGDEVLVDFDMSGWVKIERFPASADVYLWDTDRRPLALGFRVGQGYVFFTSFHHHAQDGQESSGVAILLDWLVSLSTQHQGLLGVAGALAELRSPVMKRSVGNIGNEPELVRLDFGPRRGLGVFALSWEPHDQVSYSLRFLRRNEILEIEETSSEPPIVITARNPSDEDVVEICRVDRGDVREGLTEKQPYVFAASLRRELLGEVDWFALALSRHIAASPDDLSDTPTARTHVSRTRIREAIISILNGLGFVVRLDHHNDPDQGDWADVAAFDHGVNTKTPALRVEAYALDAPDGGLDIDGETLDYRGQQTPTYPIREFSPATEHLLVHVSVSKMAFEAPAKETVAVTTTRRTSASTNWHLMSSASIELEDEGIITLERMDLPYRLNVAVYRLERAQRNRASEDASQTSASGDVMEK